MSDAPERIVEGLRPPLSFRRHPRDSWRPKLFRTSTTWTLPAGVFEPEDIAILHDAYKKACLFLGQNLNPGKRREIAAAIILHARQGLRDPNRLALKAIVAI